MARFESPDEDLSKILDKIETRNETIASDGKTATVEIKPVESNNWVPIYLIKEDDGWKIKKDFLTS